MRLEDVVRNSGFDTGFNMKEIDEEKDDLIKDIKKAFHHTEDIYKTIKLKENIQYFKCVKKYEYDRYSSEKMFTFYIPYSELKGDGMFHPVDENGNELSNIKCNFKKQSVCSLEILSENNYNYREEWSDLNDFTPKILFAKGDKKEVEDYVVSHFESTINELSKKLQQVIDNVEDKKNDFLERLDTPFVLKEKITIVIESIDNQIKDLKVRYKDCELLISSIK